MKNVLKILGVIALVAVIGFGVVGCGGDDDTGGGGGGGDDGVVTLNTYVGQYKTEYTLSGMQANEFVTVEKTTAGDYVLTIEEKMNNTSIDKLVFAIDSWEDATVPTDVVDPNAEADQTVFKNGFKLKGKITSTTPGYLPSNKTTPGFVAADAGASTTTECWMFIWVGTYKSGKVLVRSPFSKATSGTGFNENTHFVTGGDSIIRIYKK